jgi:hypothetical protein
MEVSGVQHRRIARAQGRSQSSPSFTVHPPIAAERELVEDGPMLDDPCIQHAQMGDARM